MIPALIAIGVGAILVMANWDKVVDWLRGFASKIRDLFRNVGHAAKLFAKKASGRIMQLIHKLYFRDEKTNKPMLKTTIAEVSEDEIPDWALSGMSQKETDVTSRYENKLELTLS